MKRALLSFFIASALLNLSAVTNASGASNSPGGKCTKVGTTAKSGKTPVQCVKSGKKLIWKKVAAAKATPSPVKSTTGTAYNISINASQWSWKFSYSKVGANAAVSDPSSQSSVLYIPQGERVSFTLNSADVSHGFWIPGLMIDMTILPSGANHLEFTAHKVGTYPGRCNVICGREHSTMIFTAKVVTPAEYLTYLSTLKPS